MSQYPIRFAVPALPPASSLKFSNVSSAAVVIAAVLLFLASFVLPRSDIASVGLVATVAALGTIAILHLRFLSLAHHNSYETTGLLANSERVSQSIFENAQDPMLVLDESGVCERANPSAGIFFSISPDKIIGKPLRLFYADEQSHDTMWRQLVTDHRYQGEAELVRADGATVKTRFIAKAHFLPNRHLMIFRDITQSRSAQESVRQSLLAARASQQEAETLRKASIALTQDLRMNHLLDSLLEALSQSVPYERAQLFLLESDERCFLGREAVRHGQVATEPALPEMFDFSEYPTLGRVLAIPEGVFVTDMVAEQCEGAPGEILQARSWIAVPLISSNEVLGLLSLTDSAPHAFTSHHLNLTRSLGRLAAVAIEHARLYERAAITEAELERTIAALRQVELGSAKSPIDQSAWFETIFRSAPVALSVSVLTDGEILLANEAFQRSFGFLEFATKDFIPMDLELWEDPRDRTKLIERLGRGVRIRGAVARLRRRSGSFEETMYSAERIALGEKACLLLAIARDEGVSERMHEYH